MTYEKGNLKVGDFVYLGQYVQLEDILKPNIAAKEPIRWKVVKIIDGRYAMLLAYKSLDFKKYNNENKVATWKDCSLRKWLNEEFYNSAFNDYCKNIMVDHTINSNGVDVKDKVFILSEAEVQGLNADDRIGRASDCLYWNAAYSGPTASVNGGYITVPYWLRSDRTDEGKAFSCYNPTSNPSGNNWRTEYITNTYTRAVRPAILVDMSSSHFNIDNKISINLDGSGIQYKSRNNTQDPSHLWNNYSNYFPGSTLPTTRYFEFSSSVNNKCLYGWRINGSDELYYKIPDDQTGDIELTPYLGDKYIYYGVYPQNDSSGTQKEPIKWKILDVDAERVVLISDAVLDHKVFDSGNNNIWKDSEIRQWLNDDFKQKAFTEEINVIKDVNNKESEEDIIDKIYLISRNEQIAWNPGIRKPTTYAKNVKIRYGSRDEQLSVRTTGDNPGYVDYWMREKGSGNSVMYINHNRYAVNEPKNSASVGASDANRTGYGVAPIISIDTNKLTSIKYPENNNVTLDLNGAILKSGSEGWSYLNNYHVGQTLPTIDNIIIPEGKTFYGWTINDSSVLYTAIPVDQTGDIVLKVSYEEPVKKVNIQVDDNYATYSGETVYKDVDVFNSAKSSISNNITVKPTWQLDGFEDEENTLYKKDLSDFTWDGTVTKTLTAKFSRIIKNLKFEIDEKYGAFDPGQKLTYTTEDVPNIGTPSIARKVGYKFISWVKKNTTTVVVPENWDGVEDITLVANFETLNKIVFSYTGSEAVLDPSSTTEYDNLSDRTSVELPRYTPNEGKKQTGWDVSGETKTDDEVKEIIKNYDGSSPLNITPKFDSLKKIAFEIDTADQSKGSFNSSAKLVYYENETGITPPNVNASVGFKHSAWKKTSVSPAVRIEKTDIANDISSWTKTSDVTYVVEFAALKKFVFDIPMDDVESISGDTEFDEEHFTNIRIPTITPKNGKKVDGWIVNGETKTEAEVNDIIDDWKNNPTNDIVVVPVLATIKTLTFEIDTNKATVDATSQLAFDSNSTNITRPSFTRKKGFGFVNWRRGSTDVADADLPNDINDWKNLTETNKDNRKYVAIFRNLKKVTLDIPANLTTDSFSPDDLIFDELDNIDASTLPNPTPKAGYKPGGWSTSKNPSATNILSDTELGQTIQDWKNAPTQDMKITYVFLDDDTIMKIKFIVDKTKCGLNGEEIYVDTTAFENAKANIKVVPFNGYKFVSWKNTVTGETFSLASDITWDGSKNLVFEAVLNKVNNGNNGNNGGNNNGGRSSSDSSSYSPEVKPPQGFDPNKPQDPQNPLLPNNPPIPANPNKPHDPTDDMSTTEKRTNPPADNYIIVNMDDGLNQSNTTKLLNAYDGSFQDSSSNSSELYKWETKDKMAWRLMNLNNVAENVDYTLNPSNKSVVSSLDTNRAIYYKLGWAFLEYNGTTGWYHFGNNNYMDTGWFEQHGVIYFLQTDYNETFGRMYTGVHNIGGVNYEFARNGALIGIKQ